MYNCKIPLILVNLTDWRFIFLFYSFNKLFSCKKNSLAENFIYSNNWKWEIMTYWIVINL